MPSWLRRCRSSSRSTSPPELRQRHPRRRRLSGPAPRHHVREPGCGQARPARDRRPRTRHLMRPARHPFLALSLTATLLGACGASGESPAPTSAPRPPDGAAFLLRVETEQAIPPLARFGETPAIVITLDGRVLTGRSRSGDLPGAARQPDRPAAAHAGRLDEDRRGRPGGRPADGWATDWGHRPGRDGAPSPDRGRWADACGHGVQPCGGLPVRPVPGSARHARRVPGLRRPIAGPLVARHRRRSGGAVRSRGLRRGGRPRARRPGPGAATDGLAVR